MNQLNTEVNRKDLYLECYERLLQHREKLLDVLKRKHSNETVSELIDRATRDYYLHTSVNFRNRMALELKEVEKALFKLENGGYGICEISGEEIEPARLKAVPWTKISVKAMERVESAIAS